MKIKYSLKPCATCGGRGVYESADVKTGQRLEFECYSCDGKGVVVVSNQTRSET